MGFITVFTAATAAFALSASARSSKVSPPRSRWQHLPPDHEWGRHHYAWHHDWHWDHHGPPPGPDVHIPNMGNSTFSQLIDHSNPDLGTFEQFYYYSTEFWKGPGSPVVAFTPGEVNATGYASYLSTNRTTGVTAKEIGAAVVVIEHRYWGTSTPFTELTTANMTYLTLENSIKDFTYFANNVKFPFAHHASSNAKDVPWVFMGGSYSGALAAWIESIDSGTFWAYLASSAPVQAISDYYGYFLPVQQGMPKNCSTDVSLVVDHMDDIFTNGSPSEISALKTRFGVDSIEHVDDVMAFLEWGPWLWQNNQFYANGGFFEWCDYIENSVNASSNNLPGAEGVGLEKALSGYARWVQNELIPGFCEDTYGYYSGDYNLECTNTYNFSSPLFRDTSLSNTIDRQWQWMLCNEPFGYWQTGAPADRPTIVSRLVDANYWSRQCALWFPPGANGETFGLAQGRSEADTNAYTQGWSFTNSTRLMYTNGEFDPWREASVSADLRPGGPLQSTEQVPVNIVPGGYHVSDFITRNGEVNAGVQAAIDREVAQLKAWVGEWPTKRHWQG
ncbi:hypothetical protein MBLNU230_g6789t1 [Neophaeotheca triangularis]